MAKQPQTNGVNVKVVGLNIPFWDLVTLTIYNGFAVLMGIFVISLIVGVPIFLFWFLRYEDYGIFWAFFISLVWFCNKLEISLLQ